MKIFFFLTLFFSFLGCNFLYSQTYTLNWASSFSPAWSDGNLSGTASNIGGSGINATITISKTGGIYAHTNGGSGVATPTVSGSTLMTGTSSTNLEIGVDFNNHGEHAEIVYQFSSHVTHVVFDIADIDKPGINSNASLDEVVVSGSDGTGTHFPVLTRYDATTDPSFLIISGDVARVNSNNGSGGNSASSSIDQKGTIIADFGNNLISSITIRYKNASGSQNDPAAQNIAIGNLSFQKPILVPVTFTYIKAKVHPHQTSIYWQTATEHNNKHFEIEKSNANQSWSKIGTVQGSMESYSLKNYSFTDPVINPGITYYRVRQVDQDGKSRYSEIVTVTHTHKHFIAEIYPNPVEISSVISLYADHPDEVIVTIIDALGKTLASEEWIISKGTNELSLMQLADLARGHYFVRLNNAAGYSRTLKFVKK